MTNKQLWQAALGELELTLSKVNFNTWFKNTFIISSDNGEIIIGVPNAFTKEWLENKYHKNVFKALQNITGMKIKKISYQVFFRKENLTPISDIIKNTKQQKQSIQKIDPESGLNPKYTFDNFIVGSHNELAQAAARAVATKPGTTYNPLFIYGGVGLGKTHLLQALGNKAKQKSPSKKVKYVTCEKFTNDLINSISSHQANGFKNKYRNIDILIIDDIQFLTGKEKTQEEFFHTFNALYEDNRQIVISSDRPPKAIPTIEDRLRSRFEGGMIADIGVPDLETRVAILEAKCRDKNIEFTEEIINYIATNIQYNIRELEGALNRIIAYGQLNNRDIDLETTKNILSSIITPPRRRAITPKQILEAVALFYDIDKKDLILKNRRKEIVWPRQIAMFLMREEINTSYPTIGQEVGGRDHTTAMHAYEKVLKKLEQDEGLRQEMDLIKQKLYIS